MSKILILANSDIGLFKFRKELIEKLIKQGNTMYLSMPRGDFTENLVAMGCIFEDTNVDRRGMNPFKDTLLAGSYFRMIAKIHPDLVITYTIKPNIYGGIACRTQHVKYAINITGLGTTFQNKTILSTFVVNLYRFALRKAETIFFENPTNMKVMSEYGIAKDSQCYLNNGAGVNLEEFSFKEYPKENQGIDFLFIGRLMKEKGIEELLQAAKSIKEKFKNVDFHIIGIPEEDYKSLLDDNICSGTVIFHGYQSDVREYIEKCHCIILPSHHEGMSNVLLEGCAMGRPLITSDVPGCREAFNGKNGFLSIAENSSDLYEKINSFLGLTYDQRMEMGRQSRLHVERYFNREEVISNTIARLFAG